MIIFSSTLLKESFETSLGRKSKQCKNMHDFHSYLATGNYAGDCCQAFVHWYLKLQLCSIGIWADAHSLDRFCTGFNSEPAELILWFIFTNEWLIGWAKQWSLFLACDRFSWNPSKIHFQCKNSIVKPLNLQSLEAFKSLLLSNWSQCLKSDSTFKFFLKRAGRSPKRLPPSQKSPLFVLARPTTPKLCQGARGAAPRAQPSWLIFKFAFEIFNCLVKQSLRSGCHITCQMMSRVSNLDSNLNSAAWPTSGEGFLKARLAPAKNWKDVLQCRENRQKECIGVASVISRLITFACSDFAGPDSGPILVEGYVHGNEPIRLGSLKRGLPMNHAALPKLLEITFEAISEHNSTTDDTESIPPF